MIPAKEKFIKEGVENICEASFSYDRCFCSVDILRNLGNKKLELYEVKSSTSVNWIYEHDVSYQYYVLTKLGYEVQKACLVYINNEYIRHGELELDKLFTINDLTDIAIAKFAEVETNIKKFRKYLEQKDEPACDIGDFYSDPYECGFWNYCAKDMPTDGSYTVWDIANFRKKQQLYDKGLITFEPLFRYRNNGSSTIISKNIKGVPFMNETLQILKSRRSCRKFILNKLPSEADLNAIIEAGTYAPSGMGRQPVKIIAVTNKKMRNKISEENAKVMGQSGTDPFYGAPVILIVIADKSAPTSIYDGSLVMGNLLNAAEGLGLGSIWIHRAKEEFESDFENSF